MCQLNCREYEDAFHHYWPYSNLEGKLELKRVIENDILSDLVDKGMLPHTDAKVAYQHNTTQHTSLNSLPPHSPPSPPTLSDQIWSVNGEKNSTKAASWWSMVRSLTDICLQVTLNSVSEGSSESIDDMVHTAEKPTVYPV